MDPTRKLVERRENSLLSLFELSRELSVGLDPYAIAQLTLFSLMGHFGAAAAALWLLPEAPENPAVLLRGFGVGEDAARALGPGLAARVAEIDGAPGATRLADWAAAKVPEAAAALELGLALAAPVPVQGRLVGVIGLGPRLDGEAYGPFDLEYLATAAGMVGVALENARLYHRTRESNRQLRETNERLAELDRLKSEFLGNVNHELRTPLSVIIGYLDVLRATQANSTTQEAIAIASKHAAKLEAMLENLLDYSRLEEQALRLKLEPHDLGDLLRGYAEERRPGVANGLREFTLELEPQLPPAACDPRRLLQIVDELMDNAIKFTLPGSRIRLRARRCAHPGAEGILIEIDDDGPGIPADRLEALFEPFRQGDGSTTREAGGLGLGLALARRLAEAMGGGLDAKSEPGVGSSFVVRLKAA